MAPDPQLRPTGVSSMAPDPRVTPDRVRPTDVRFRTAPEVDFGVSAGSSRTPTAYPYPTEVGWRGVSAPSHRGGTHLCAPPKLTVFRCNGCADHGATRRDQYGLHMEVLLHRVRRAPFVAVDDPSESRFDDCHRSEPTQPVRARWKHGGNAIAPVSPGFGIFQNK